MVKLDGCYISWKQDIVTVWLGARVLVHHVDDGVDLFLNNVIAVDAFVLVMRME